MRPPVLRLAGTLFPVGNPDVLNLRSMAQEVAAFGLLRVVPVDGVAVGGPGLLHVADAGELDHGGCRLVAEGPDGVDVVVVGERLANLGGAAGDDVDDTAGQVAGVEGGGEVGHDGGVALAEIGRASC